ncbi:hypothetical protein [Paenibacillus lautus]
MPVRSRRGKKQDPLEEVNYENVKRDWICYEDNPVATGTESLG